MVAEYVSLGHPDKMADVITEFLLDYCDKKQNGVRYGVEVLLKDNTIIFAGESSYKPNNEELLTITKDALRFIGYDEQYHSVWRENAIDITRLEIINLIGEQSPEIAKGLQNGWGDQGVFIGYAGDNLTYNTAKKINNDLYTLARKEIGRYGLDIKTIVTAENNKIKEVVAAIPTKYPEEIFEKLQKEYPEAKIIVNGTGSYIRHSTIADSGVTGRKLAVDFYGGFYGIGGGCPWGKDYSKADLTLNLYAKKIAEEINSYTNKNTKVVLSCAIGQPEILHQIYLDGELYKEYITNEHPSVVIDRIKKPYICLLK